MKSGGSNTCSIGTGRVDILVNNAGVMDTNQGVGEAANEMWDIDVDV
jgi:NADP-dependent 3-hydroxy acid dehydrogenase YdfG